MTPNGAVFQAGRLSLQLDNAGNPVISFTTHGLGDLRVLHCVDVNCAQSGSVSIIETVGWDDTAQTSLALDGRVIRR